VKSSETAFSRDAQRSFAKGCVMNFQLPELGEGIYEAELIRWLVKPGDVVRRGQALMEVMTDKATMEVPSPFAGAIESLSTEEGRPLKVGAVVLTYGAPEKMNEGEKAGGGEGAKKNDAGTKRRGDTVKEEADRLGGDGVKRREGARRREGEGARTAVAAPPKAAPSVRLMARKLNIDLDQVHGSGSGGRILIEDLTSQITAQHQTSDAHSLAPSPTRPLPPSADYGKPGARLKFQGVRRKMAENMVRAKHVVAHSTYVDECDVTELVRLRESLRDRFSQAGLKLTYLPFFVKAVTLALREIPIVNSSLDEQAEEIVLHDHYHIGFAAATPTGLIVPVLHDADQKALPEIARELERLNAEAKGGKSRLEDLRGGTFTITSIGGFGGLISTPVVNHPQAAILGIGRIVKRPVYDSAGNIKPADLVYLSLSFDHRFLDGAVAAAFCNAVIRHLQTPAALLLPQNLAYSGA
jgi:pyruvate dehydrogenase E2 component (dihydrolipoamide acetyltransferase)/2-oxoisovalerate dehydrogenase E2 component (dihydrolipoyl transacylase)